MSFSPLNTLTVITCTPVVTSAGTLSVRELDARDIHTPIIACALILGMNFQDWKMKDSTRINVEKFLDWGAVNRKVKACSS